MTNQKIEVLVDKQVQAMGDKYIARIFVGNIEKEFVFLEADSMFDVLRQVKQTVVKNEWESKDVRIKGEFAHSDLTETDKDEWSSLIWDIGVPMPRSRLHYELYLICAEIFENGYNVKQCCVKIKEEYDLDNGTMKKLQSLLVAHGESEDERNYDILRENLTFIFDEIETQVSIGDAQKQILNGNHVDLHIQNDKGNTEIIEMKRHMLLDVLKDYRLEQVLNAQWMLITESDEWKKSEIAN